MSVPTFFQDPRHLFPKTPRQAPESRFGHDNGVILVFVRVGERRCQIRGCPDNRHCDGHRASIARAHMVPYSPNRRSGQRLFDWKTFTSPGREAAFEMGKARYPVSHQDLLGQHGQAQVVTI